ncbi:MAG: hypothetical protein A2202_01760 [Bdellovibrionales bacterium RIFOXYA1_FULL_36_14]|nr:MAG: hypothetical protein A2202_01760 [Bdellovibrionales bacterium RIFOXYA1_FULL_36_14]
MGYTPLRIKTIKPRIPITFDLFIYFKDTYLKYRDSGTNFEQDIILQLKKQKFAQFYIDDADENKYQKYLDNILANLADSKDVTVEEKADIIEGNTSRAIERMKENPTSESSFNASKVAVKSLREVITKNPAALKIIFGRESEDDDKIIKHSLNVCMLATKLAEKEGVSGESLDNLAVAALLHDLGIGQLDEQGMLIFMKPKKSLNVQEKKIYKTHPKKATDLLQNKPYINKEILDLIFNYGENLNGEGAQGKKVLSKTEAILSIVNCYDKKIITSNLSPKEALKDLQISELGNYDLDLINSFKDLLKKEGILDL